MILVKNKIIPFGKFTAITIWPFIFYKGEIDDKIITHESIHLKQQAELLIIPFYILYLTEWLLKLFVTMSTYRAYRSISFEQEAYNNQSNTDYLTLRKRYSSFKYIFKLWKWPV